jgi:5-deoxy-glucuronate isomerase
MNLLIKPRKNSKEVASVTPESAGWGYVSFSVYQLPAGETLTFSEDAKELCAIILTGIVSAEAGGQAWHEIGGRKSVFDDEAPYAVYVPPHTKLTVTAKTETELAVGGAPAKGELPVRLIEPANMRRVSRGKGTNTRHVCEVLPEGQPAESLLIFEVKTPSSHSSSYPPHKHDVDNLPTESLLEETYYHHINPPQGFVFQRVYTDSRDIDESMAIEDRDVVLVPRGYHPVVVPHGYDSYYLNVMAGPKRIWRFQNDPAHDWIVSAG